VVDWGLARSSGAAAEDRAAGEAAVVGTPAYMPPEQADPTLGPVGPPADVHALGATLFFLLAGEPSVRAATRAEAAARLFSGPPPSPRAVDPSVPRELDAVCRKAM